MKNSILFLTILLLFCAQPINKSFKEIKFSPNAHNLPIINGSLNGLPAKYIINTAITNSFINYRAKKKYNLNLIPIDRYDPISKENYLFAIYRTNNVYFIGNLLLPDTFHSIDFNDIKCYHGNDSIDVIIGTDIITEYNMSIDFKNSLLKIN